MSKGLYTLADNFGIIRCDLDGMEGCGKVYFATPEEIKANHGTCETCEYRANYHCDNPDSFAYGAVFSYPSIAYCNHHVPKET